MSETRIMVAESEYLLKPIGDSQVLQSPQISFTPVLHNIIRGDLTQS